MSERYDLVLGARLGLRDAARQVLEALDDLAEHEVAASGWTRDEIAVLERVAAMPITGVPFGNWPR